jgi:uncharacterized protein with FMN-binding domain
MKKLLLSFGLIGTFFLYGLHQQQEKAEIKVIPPQANPTPTDTVSQNQQSSTTGSATTPPPVGPTQTPVTLSQPTTAPRGMYKDGLYVGDVADAFYGNIQVQAIIQNGKITDVQFLQYPNDRGESIMINTQAMPYLKQEAIAAQSAQVDIVSGATDSSQAFIQSLGSALAKAK